jgi:two-component system nitrate/nitrite response regulator NarL
MTTLSRASTKTLLLIDSGRLFADALAAMLTGTGFSVGSEGLTMDALRRQGADALPADIILLDRSSLSPDADQPREMAVDLTTLGRLFPQAKLVVFCASLTSRSLASVFAAGASGYLLKDISCAALVESLNLVAVGEKVFPTRLAELLADIDASTQNQSSLSLLGPLTSREWEVLSRVGQGESNKVIAKTLSITEATVKVHVRRAMRKINARNRTQAAVWLLNRSSAPAPDLAAIPARSVIAGQPGQGGLAAVL